MSDSKDTEMIQKEATTMSARVYTLILINIIYFEEFIVNLIRFEALMPFLWMLKNVNIELFCYLFNLRFEPFPETL